MSRKQITALTPEQSAYLPEFRDEYLRQATGGLPTDREELTSAIAAAYKEIGKQPPIVVVLKSPAQALVAMRVLQNIQKKAATKNFKQDFNDRFDFSLRRRIREAVIKETDSAAWSEMLNLRGRLMRPLITFSDHMNLLFSPHAPEPIQRVDEIARQMRQIGFEHQMVDQISQQISSAPHRMLINETYDLISGTNMQITSALQQSLSAQLYRNIYYQIDERLSAAFFSAFWQSFDLERSGMRGLALGTGIGMRTINVQIQRMLATMPWSSENGRPSLSSQITNQVWSDVWRSPLIEELHFPLRDTLGRLSRVLDRSIASEGIPRELVGTLHRGLLDNLRIANSDSLAGQVRQDIFDGRREIFSASRDVRNALSDLIPFLSSITQTMTDRFRNGVWQSMNRNIVAQLNTTIWAKTRNISVGLARFRPTEAHSREVIRLSRLRLRGTTYSAILTQASGQIDTEMRQRLQAEITSPLDGLIQGIVENNIWAMATAPNQWMGLSPAAIGADLFAELANKIDNGLRGHMHRHTDVKLGNALDMQLREMFHPMDMWEHFDDGLRKLLDVRELVMPDPVWGHILDGIGNPSHIVRRAVEDQLEEQDPPKLFLPQAPQDLIVDHLVRRVIAQVEDRLDRIANEQAKILLQERLADLINAELQSESLWSKDIYNHNYLWGSQDLYWIAWGKFAEHIGVQYDADTSRRLEIMRRIGFQCEWWWPYEGICFASERPKVHFDASQRLHSEVGPAIEYSDGYSLYFWHGVAVPAHWIEDRANLNPAEVLRVHNVEQRAAGAAICGWPKMLSVLGEKVINAHPNPSVGSLIELKLPGLDLPGRFLKAHCPRNGMIVEGVPRTSDIDGLPINTALAAQAWRIGVPAKSFKIPPRRT